MEKDFNVHCYHCYLVQLIIYHLPVKQAADLRTLNWASGWGWIPIHSNLHTPALPSTNASFSGRCDHMAAPLTRDSSRHHLTVQFFVGVFPVLSLHLRWDCGPGLQSSWCQHPHHSAPAPVGDKFESCCCSHLGRPGQASGPGFCPSVDPMSAVSPPTLRCVQSPRAQTINWSRF